jgi:hypothetical protein
MIVGVARIDDVAVKPGLSQFLQQATTIHSIPPRWLSQSDLAAGQYASSYEDAAIAMSHARITMATAAHAAFH